MLSHFKSYLFGEAETSVVTSANGTGESCSLEDEEWVLVDENDVITELPIADDAPAPSLALDESWIVAQGPSLPTLPVLMAPGPKRWQRNQQPKGTKRRRVRSSGLRRPSAAALIVAPVDDDDTDDSASLSSSIAVIPAPEMPRSVETITASVSPSTILSASSASAKQAAAISSSKLAKRQKEKTWMSRKSLSRQSMMASAVGIGHPHRRKQHLANRFCGSNNNRKCASNFANNRKC